MLGVRLGVVGILAREDVKVLTVYVALFKEKKEKEDATLLS
jgi:hypothetical protein